MTREAILNLTGFSQVGEGKAVRGLGVLFGFPVEATAPRNRHLTLIFTTAEAVKPKVLRQARRVLRQDKELRRIISFLPANQTNVNSGMLMGVVAGGAIGGAVAAGVSRAANAGVVGTGFTVVLKLKDELSARRQYEAAVARLQEIFREVGITAPEGCIFCGQPGGETLAKYGALHLVHRNCLHNWRNATKERLETKRHNTGHLQGFLGGLIGGLVAAIPTVLVLRFFELFVWILFALIPMGIFYGWRLFRGRLSRVTTVFTVLYTLILAPLTVIAYEFLMFLHYFPGAPLDWFLDLLLIPEVFAEVLLPNIGMALVAAAVGIWIAWRMVSRTDQQELTQTLLTVDESVSIEPMGHQLSDREPSDVPVSDQDTFERESFERQSFERESFDRDSFEPPSFERESADRSSLNWEDED